MNLLEPWQAQARCLETGWEPFYVDQGDSADVAKRMCVACPVRRECLAYALDINEQFGIWGGLNPRQRHKLRKAMQRNPELQPLEAMS